MIYEPTSIKLPIDAFITCRGVQNSSLYTCTTKGEGRHVVYEVQTMCNYCCCAFNEILVFDVIRWGFLFYFYPCRSDFALASQASKKLDHNSKINCIKIAIDCAFLYSLHWIKTTRWKRAERRKKNHRRMTDSHRLESVWLHSSRINIINHSPLGYITGFSVCCILIYISVFCWSRGPFL